jgi:hypothetical protein
VINIRRLQPFEDPPMNRAIVAALAPLALLLGLGSANAASSSIQVGRLACDVAPGVGLIIVSSKSLTCAFHRDGFRTEHYSGSINKVGIDIGFTGRAHIEWLVFAATHTRYTPHALAGQYFGASAQATIGVGLGANALVGGFHRSYALQPLSVQAQTGLNASLALAGLTLR